MVRLPQRILVLGCPGSGKSTLARQLARKRDLPVFHLDDYYWHEGWTKPDPIQWRDTLEALVRREEWILDGNHQDTLAIRLERATSAIVLDMSAALCLYRVARRGLVRFLGETKSLPLRVRPGRLGRFSLDPRFVAKVVLFRQRELPTLLRELAERGDVLDVRVLRSTVEVREFLMA